MTGFDLAPIRIWTVAPDAIGAPLATTVQTTTMQRLD